MVWYQSKAVQCTIMWLITLTAITQAGSILICSDMCWMGHWTQWEQERINEIKNKDVGWLQ